MSKDRKRGRPFANEGKTPTSADRAVFTEWCERIASGKTERFAAIGLPVKYKTLLTWATRDEDLYEELEDAKEMVVQAHLDESREAPMLVGKSEDDDGLHPAAAALVQKHAWNHLRVLDRERFGEGRRLETVGKGGGPVQNEIKILLADAVELAKEKVA